MIRKLEVQNLNPGWFRHGKVLVLEQGLSLAV